MKRIGLILLFGGFLFGAFFAVQREKSIDWFMFAPAAAAMLTGLILVRIVAHRAKGDTEGHEESLGSLSTSLDGLIERLGAMNAARESTDVYEVHGQIDATLMDDLNAFVESREVIIPTFGLQRYADVMSAFANGERNINRAWSASADGYVDEVWASLLRAERLMRDAKSQLESAKAA